MATRRQVQAHEGVARIEQGIEHRLVGIGAGMGLDVGKGGAEQLLGPLDGQSLGDVDIFAAAVIALAGIAFSILVGQDGPLRLQHRLGDDVLRRNQLDLVALAVQFVFYRVEDFRIGCLQSPGEKAGIGGGGIGGSRHVKGLFATGTGMGDDIAPPRRNGGFTPSGAPNLAFRASFQAILATPRKSCDFPDQGTDKMTPVN